MWLSRHGDRTECSEAHDALERCSGAEQLASGELLAQLPGEVRAHLQVCADCRTFASELLEVRAMLRSAETGPEPGPYFLPRVMAAISDRENQLEQISRTWAAVPRLAYRLSVLASLSLLLAASWLYQQPGHASVAGVSAEQNSEGLVDTSGAAAQDDFLLSDKQQ